MILNLDELLNFLRKHEEQYAKTYWSRVGWPCAFLVKLKKLAWPRLEDLWDGEVFQLICELDLFKKKYSPDSMEGELQLMLGKLIDSNRASNMVDILIMLRKANMLNFDNFASLLRVVARNRYKRGEALLSADHQLRSFWHVLTTLDQSKLFPENYARVLDSYDYIKAVSALLSKMLIASWSSHTHRPSSLLLNADNMNAILKHARIFDHPCVQNAINIFPDKLLTPDHFNVVIQRCEDANGDIEAAATSLCSYLRNLTNVERLRTMVTVTFVPAPEPVPAPAPAAGMAPG